MPTCNLKTTGGMSHYRGQHNVTYTYEYDRRDATTPIIRNPLDVVAEARGASPDPVPRAGAPLSFYNIYAQRFNATPTRENRSVWIIKVDFLPPPQGEDQTQNDPTLLPWERALVYDVRPRDKEWVVAKAWNRSNLHGARNDDKVDAVPDSDNDLSKQIAICNSLLIEPDAPAMIDTERNIVFVIKQNFQFLNAFIQLERDFAKSTNSSAISLPGTPAITIPAHNLVYRGSFSTGLQYEEVDPEFHPGFPNNQVSYYPVTTEIEWVQPNSFLTLNNVSYYEWDPQALDPDDVAGVAVRIQEGPKNDRQDVVVPQNVDLNGKQSKDPVEISWRHLKTVDYSDFFPNA